MDAAIAVAALGIILLLYWCLIKKGPLAALPGPKGVPYIGHMHLMDAIKPHQSLSKLAKQYGPIFKLKFFGEEVVVCSSRELIHEVLVAKGNDFADRPQLFRVSLVGSGDSILFYPWGNTLRVRRKLMHSAIKQYGSGMNRIDDVTNLACDTFLDQLRNQNNCSFHILPIINAFVHHVITVLILGKFHDDPEERELIYEVNNRLQKAVAVSLQGQLLDSFPWLRHFGMQISKDLSFVTDNFRAVCKKWIYMVSKEKDIPEDALLPIYLKMLSEEKDKYEFTDEAVYDQIYQVIGAGTMTTVNTLMGLINILIHRPDIQRALQDEIHQLIGTRPVQLSDRTTLPYHQAVLLEILRYTSIVPTLIPHKTATNTSLGPYKLPKGTMVWCDAWHLHHDDTFWEEPFTFRPERFLHSDGSVVEPDHPTRKHVFAFSAGPRGCLGEVFALSRMFLFLARLMQELTLLPETTIEAQASPDPSEYVAGSTLIVPDFKLRVKANE